MLIEMWSPVFIENGKVRNKIVFKNGLNVILGKEDGENSIGKSSAMLAIDFVFGGNTYINSDGVKHIGHHTIFFTFEFDRKKYHFARNTAIPDEFQYCTKDYEQIGIYKTRAEFTNWLKQMYHIDFLGLSFRLTVSSFFRIYGKENNDERRPLRGRPGQGMQESIDILVKLFDRYKDIEAYNAQLAEQKKKLEAFKEARRYDFISNLVGGKKALDDNNEKIRSLESQLLILTENTEREYPEEDVEKSKVKTELFNQKLVAETELQSKQRKLKLLNMSIEYGLYPTEQDLESLTEFFPDVNLRKIYEVEKYHQKLATILSDQFEAEKEKLQTEIATFEGIIKVILTQINELGFVGNVSKEFLDRYSEIKGEISALERQNQAFLTQQELTDAKKRADELLKKGIEDTLITIETDLNKKMKEYNDSLFDESRKAPTLHFKEYNSYTFETPDDTGTGSNFKGMVIYDLAVLNTTSLPAIAHDSLILKNISDNAIDGIMKIYAQSQKQIFIAFDKQAAYPENTRNILKRNKILQLSDNGCELYGQSWNKENK